MLEHLSRGVLVSIDPRLGQMYGTQPRLREDLAAGRGVNCGQLEGSSPTGLWLSHPRPTALKPHKYISEMFNATEKFKTCRTL